MPVITYAYLRIEECMLDVTVSGNTVITYAYLQIEDFTLCIFCDEVITYAYLSIFLF